MKKFFKGAVACGLACMACLSMTACGDDKNKISNEDAFGTVYAAATTYGNNIKMIQEGSEDETQFEFKLGLSVDIQGFESEEATQISQLMKLDLQAVLGAKIADEKQVYAYLSTKGFDNQMKQWMHAYLCTKADDDTYISAGLERKPDDWDTSYGDYYIAEPNYVLNTSAEYDDDNYYYVKVEIDNSVSYNLVAGKPEDWDTAYGNYYIYAPNYVLNTDPVFDESKIYYTATDLLYAYTSIDSNQFMRYTELTGKPADWDTKWSTYYVVETDQYTLNVSSVYDENVKYYKRETSISGEILDIVSANLDDGKIKYELPIAKLSEILQRDEDDESNLPVDVDYNELLETLESIQSYDDFKALVETSGATISASKDDKGVKLIVSSSTTVGYASTSTSLEIIALNDGSMKLVYTTQSSAMGVVVSKIEVALTLSMTETFDQTQVPTDLDSYIDFIPTIDSEIDY